MSSGQIIKSKFALQAPELHQSITDMENIFATTNFEAQSAGYDTDFGTTMTSYPPQFNIAAMQDFSMDPMDLEFAKYIQVTT